MDHIDASPASRLAELENQDGIRVTGLSSPGSPRLDDQTTRHNSKCRPESWPPKALKAAPAFLPILAGAPVTAACFLESRKVLNSSRGRRSV